MIARGKDVYEFVAVLALSVTKMKGEGEVAFAEMTGRIAGV